ncbi:hypothetical protein [Rahnella sp. PAMC 25559]|uniref:hypothetical protein n=1 Tax=Rahnella sp. PAMC 25559 TaxID=3423225 RepID=UPI003D664929
MEGLQTAALLERIALIAKLATSTDCHHDELERVAIWIAEMAVTAKKDLLAVIFNVDAGLNRGGCMVCVGKINDDLSGISLSHPRNNQQGFWLAITVYSPTILSGEHYL